MIVMPSATACSYMDSIVALYGFEPLSHAPNEILRMAPRFSSIAYCAARLDILVPHENQLRPRRETPKNLSIEISLVLVPIAGLTRIDSARAAGTGIEVNC